MKTILLLVKRHPLALPFVTAAWAFIGWNMRHDLAALAMVVGAPVAFVAILTLGPRVPRVKVRDDNDPFEPGSTAWFIWGRH